MSAISMNALQSLKKQITQLREDKDPIITELQKRVQTQQGMIRSLTNELITYQKRVSLNQISVLQSEGFICNFEGQESNRKFVIVDVTSQISQGIFIYNNGAKLISKQELDSLYNSQKSNLEAKQNFSKLCQNFEKEVCSLQVIVTELRSQMNELKRKYEENVDQQLLSITKGVVENQQKKYTLSTPQILLQQSLGSSSDKSKQLPMIKQQKKSFDLSIAEVSSLSLGEDLKQKQKIINSPQNLRKQCSLPPCTQQKKEQITLNGKSDDGKNQIPEEEERQQESEKDPEKGGKVRDKQKEIQNEEEQNLELKKLTKNEAQGQTQQAGVPQIVCTQNNKKQDSKEEELKLTTFFARNDNRLGVKKQEVVHDVQKGSQQQNKQQITGVTESEQNNKNNDQDCVAEKDKNQLKEQSINYEEKHETGEKQIKQLRKQSEPATQQENTTYQVSPASQQQNPIPKQLNVQVETNDQVPLAVNEGSIPTHLDNDMTKIDEAGTVQKTSNVSDLAHQIPENKQQGNSIPIQKSIQPLVLQNLKITQTQKPVQANQLGAGQEGLNLGEIKNDNIPAKDHCIQNAEVQVPAQLMITKGQEKQQKPEESETQYKNGEQEKKDEGEKPLAENKNQIIEQKIQQTKESEPNLIEAAKQAQMCKTIQDNDKDCKIQSDKAELHPPPTQTNAVNLSDPAKEDQNQTKVQVEPPIQAETISQAQFQTPSRLQNTQENHQEERPKEQQVLTPVWRLNSPETINDAENTTSITPVQLEQINESPEQVQVPADPTYQRFSFDNKKDQPVKSKSIGEKQIDEKQNLVEEEQQREQEELSTILKVLNEQQEEQKQQNKIKSSQKNSNEQVGQKQVEKERPSVGSNIGHQIDIKSQIKQLFNFGGSTNSAKKQDHTSPSLNTQQAPQFVAKQGQNQNNTNKTQNQTKEISAESPTTPHSPSIDDEDNFMIISGDYSEKSQKNNGINKKQQPIASTQKTDQNKLEIPIKGQNNIVQPQRKEGEPLEMSKQLGESEKRNLKLSAMSGNEFQLKVKKVVDEQMQQKTPYPQAVVKKMSQKQLPLAGLDTEKHQAEKQKLVEVDEAHSESPHNEKAEEKKKKEKSKTIHFRKR